MTPTCPMDYYHIGLVVSVRPLKIINATPPSVRIDTDLSRWYCAGELNAVDYAADEPPTPAPPPDADPRLAEVWAERGSTVQPARQALPRRRDPRPRAHRRGGGRCWKKPMKPGGISFISRPPAI